MYLEGWCDGCNLAMRNVYVGGILAVAVDDGAALTLQDVSLCSQPRSWSIVPV